MSPADPGYLTDAQVIRFTFRWHCQKNQIITQPADQTKPVHLIKPEKITQHCSVRDTSVRGTENLWHLCGDNMIRIELKMWGVVNKTESFTCTFFLKAKDCHRLCALLPLEMEIYSFVFFYDKIPEARNVRWSCVSREVVF